MKITLIQTKLFWEDRKKNLVHFKSLLEQVTEPTDLIVLPEMFATGFTMNPERLAEEAGGESVQWLKKTAQEKKSVVTGSLAVKEQGKYYNRLYWAMPDGSVQTYDKRHLFRMAKEDQHYTAGNKKIFPKTGDWTICPLVCYDLRFPIWSRNKFNGDKNNPAKWEYDMLIYVANWPQVRSFAWKQLLIARAIENQCYVVGLNRVGQDGNGFEHSGDSVVIGPKGEVLLEFKPGEEKIQTFTLDKKMLDDFRTAFPAGLDADDFELR